jgi:hypothetical protein
MIPVFTNSPRVRKSPVLFFKWERLGGPAQQRLEIPREVTWVKESTTKLVYRHGGKVFQECHESRDSYGYLTSVSTCVGYAEEYSQHYKLGPSSTLELVVISTVAEHPYLEDADTVAYNAKRRDDPRSLFYEVPADWRVEQWNDGVQTWHKLLPVELASEVIWSSKNHSNRNIELQESFKSRFASAPTFV